MTRFTADQGLRIPELTDLADGPTAVDYETDGVESRLVKRYASVADRTARNPTPSPDELSIIGAAPFVYDGSAGMWVALPTTLGSQDCSWTKNGVMASSAALGSEVAMAAWTGGTNTTFVFRNGHAYRLDLTGGTATSAAAGAVGRVYIRVRKGVNTTLGQQLLRCSALSFGGGLVITFTNFSFVTNSTGADISTALGVTVSIESGTPDGIVYGDANFPLMVTVTDLGLSSVLPGITAQAAAIV